MGILHFLILTENKKTVNKMGKNLIKLRPDLIFIPERAIPATIRNFGI